MNLLSHLTNHPPSKIALRDNQQAITYGDLTESINERALKLQGISCAALAMDNSVAWVLWDLAAMKTGTALVPLPPFFTEEQSQHAMKSAGCAALITEKGISKLPFEPATLPEGTAKVTFTSGTTGTPKGVCLPLSAMENVAQSIVSVLGTDLAGIYCAVLPLGVLLENVAGVYAALTAGATIVLPSLKDFGDQYSNLCEQLIDIKASSVILVPEILRTLMMQIKHHGFLPDMRFVAVGGAKISPELIMQARVMGLPAYEGYGLSECGSVVSLNTPAHDKLTTTGQMLPHVDATIKNNEIIIRNPGFLGYIGEPHKGPFATGDLGKIDRDDFITITGRKKNVLITSYGRNVSPEWVESVLLSQPEIAQAFVYGDGHPRLSALIVPARTDIDITAAVKRANMALPEYAQIHHTYLNPPFTPHDGTLTGNGRLRRQNILEARTRRRIS